MDMMLYDIAANPNTPKEVMTTSCTKTEFPIICEHPQIKKNSEKILLHMNARMAAGVHMRRELEGEN